MEFEYKAITKEGQKKDGSISAENQTVLARQLREEGYFLVWAKAKNGPANDLKSKGINLAAKIISSFDFIFKRISLQEKMIFARHLALMVKAGFSLNKALETLTRQTQNKHFAKILKDLSANVSAGQSFHQAVLKYTQVFSPVFVSMVKVGEASGKLEETLKLSSLHLKREHALRKKIKGALTYPIVVISALIGVAMIMIIFVMPQLVSAFTEMNVALPLSTRILFGLTNFLSRYWYLALSLAAALIYFLYFFARKTVTGKNWINLMFLKIPIFSSLTKKINSARFARTLGSLLSSGVSLTEAIKITADSLNNVFYKRALENSVAAVEKGQLLSQLLAKNKDLFPPVVTEMIAVGEETGSLSVILKELAQFFESEVAIATKSMSSVVEPVIMIIVGIAVGVFALSIIQPIYTLMGGIQ